MKRLMKFDARREHTAEEKEAFVEWLVHETVTTFKNSVGNSEGLKSCVFLAVNRAHDAGLTSVEAARIIGTCTARASLSAEDEAIAFDWLEIIDPIATVVHAQHDERKPWWKFWS